MLVQFQRHLCKVKNDQTIDTITTILVWKLEDKYVVNIRLFQKTLVSKLSLQNVLATSSKWLCFTRPEHKFLHFNQCKVILPNFL